MAEERSPSNVERIESAEVVVGRLRGDLGVVENVLHTAADIGRVAEDAKATADEVARTGRRWLPVVAVVAVVGVITIVVVRRRRRRADSPDAPDGV